jgi:hypothetical protein
MSVPKNLTFTDISDLEEKALHSVTNPFCHLRMRH